MVVNVEEEDVNESTHVERFTKYLAQHGVKTVPHTIKNSKNAVQALQQYYEEQSADLLIMGAFTLPPDGTGVWRFYPLFSEYRAVQSFSRTLIRG